jgi:flagellar basal body rod protein FlgG
MPSLIYNSAIRDMATGAVDFDTDTFWVMLTTSAYTENKDTHTRRSDVTNEVTGTGYSTGGQVVTVTVGAVDTTNDRVEITLGGASWAASTITARKAIYYKRRGGAATADEIIAVNDFGADVVSSSGTLTLNSSTIRIQN